MGEERIEEHRHRLRWLILALEPVMLYRCPSHRVLPTAPCMHIYDQGAINFTYSHKNEREIERGSGRERQKL